jgi:sporulation protein YlmC with PRC-barrel domain
MDERQRQELVGNTLVDRNGEKVGVVGEIYLDDVTGRPEWFRVSTALVSGRQSFVPIGGAQLLGDSVRVAYDATTIEAAAVFSIDAHLPQEDVDRLRAHYGVTEPGMPAVVDLRDAEPAHDHPVLGSPVNPSTGAPGEGRGEGGGEGRGYPGPAVGGGEVGDNLPDAAVSARATGSADVPAESRPEGDIPGNMV